MSSTNLELDLNSLVVTAAQMQGLEEQMFAAGLPVAALMEKAALRLGDRLQQVYPRAQFKRVGILAGPGHNGGDALVVARELHLAGYEVTLYLPLELRKPLTQSQAQYAQALSIPILHHPEELRPQDWWLDGLFGIGLTRPLTPETAAWVEAINQGGQPVASIDIPSGLHTDTGATLGLAIQAQRSFCLGLWKRAYFQDQALTALGQVEKIDLGLPALWVARVLGATAPVRLFTPEHLRHYLPATRPLVSHKYQQGHALLICGSRRYPGSAILAALGARASGVGMVSIAVPQSLRDLLVSHCPEALIWDCPETPQGAIAALPDLKLGRFDAIAVGPGLTTENPLLVGELLALDLPLILDADALNILAQSQGLLPLTSRMAPTLLTPHVGEFKRLFPHLDSGDRLEAAQSSAQQSGATVLLKGARTIIAAPGGSTLLIPHSTPALARGGSGDVLTGLLAGLWAQRPQKAEIVAALGASWHAQAGLQTAHHRTLLGVDAFTLSQELIPTLANLY
jgi:NAD(P)H-hydrate epimerase